MKRILSALAVVASTATLVLGAAGTANAFQEPALYTSEVYIAQPGALQKISYVKIASNFVLPTTLPHVVNGLVRVGTIPIPFTIPAGTRFAKGINPYVIAFRPIGGGPPPPLGLLCANQVRLMGAPFPLGNFQVTLTTPTPPSLIGKTVDNSELISPSLDKTKSFHRAEPLTTTATFFAGPQTPCGRPD